MKTRFSYIVVSLAASLWLASTPPAPAAPTTAPRARLFTNSADTKGLFDESIAEPKGAGAPSKAVAGSAISGTNAAPAPLIRNMDALDDRQLLSKGDRVTFQVQEDQEPSRTLTVTDAGQLDVPELGLVRVVGKTCKQLALELKRKLEQTAYYRATVIIGLEAQPNQMVFVTGEVRRSGAVTIPPGGSLRVSQAIALAGGFTEYARKSKVVLRRDNRQIAEVDIDGVLRGKKSEDPVVQAGDTISVDERRGPFDK